MVRDDAREIHRRLEKYHRSEFQDVRNTLSRGEAYELQRWRRVVLIQEFSSAWNKREGALP